MELTPKPHSGIGKGNLLLISCAFKFVLKSLLYLLKSFWGGLFVWEKLDFNPLHFSHWKHSLEGESGSAVIQERVSKGMFKLQLSSLPDIALNVPYYPQNLLSLLGGAFILHYVVWLKVSFRALHLLAECHHTKSEGSRKNHPVLVVLQRSCKFFARYSQSCEVCNGSFTPSYKRSHRVYSTYQWVHIERVDTFTSSSAVIKNFAGGIFNLQESLWWKCSFILGGRWKRFWRVALSREEDRKDIRRRQDSYKG